MNKKLPLVSIFLEALSFPARYRQLLLKVGTPVVIVGGLYTVFEYYSADFEDSTSLIVLDFIFAIASVFTMVLGIVGCHRILLLGKESVEGSSPFSWSDNSIKYMWWWIWICVCALLVAIPLIFMAMPIFTAFLEEMIESEFVSFLLVSALFMPVYYFVSRWSLVLPSAAVGIHGKSLTWSWNLSAGNGLRLTLLVGFLPFLTESAFSYLPWYDSVFFMLFERFLWLVVGVIEVGLLSLSYKFLVSNITSDNSDKAPVEAPLEGQADEAS